MRSLSATWSGPIPPPAALREYDHAFPGTAERILKSFELQGEHRRSADNRELAQNDRLVDAQIWVLKVGTVATAVVSALGLILATILAWKDHYVPAAIVGGGEMLALTVLGVFRRKGSAAEQK